MPTALLVQVQRLVYLSLGSLLNQVDRVCFAIGAVFIYKATRIRTEKSTSKILSTYLMNYLLRFLLR